MTVSGMKVGYARVSTSEQGLTVERNALLAFGVDKEHIFVDHGLTGTNRARPGLREAMAAVRAGDTLFVSTPDRLTRSLPDARNIADELTANGVSLSLGGSTYDPADPVRRLLFNVLGMVAAFEADLIRMRTRDGMAVARARGRLRGKQPNLSAVQRKHLLSLYSAGEHTQTELAELFSVSRTMVYTGRSSAAALRRSQLRAPDADHTGVAWAQVVQ
jgi:DNA invertase Pin-like site-specific DNA recombinase